MGSQFQSRNVTRFLSQPQERLVEPCARLLLTSPPSKTVQRPSPPSASRSAPRLLTAPVIGHDTKVGPAEVVAHAAVAPAVAVAPAAPVVAGYGGYGLRGYANW